ncbi:MAG: hypothetical protein RL660_506 [Bacteroidota bacterium]
MINSKNLEPRAIAAILGVVVAAVVALVLFSVGVTWYKALLLCCGVGIIVASLCHFLVQRFLYRKIKLIYKFISASKSTYQQESLQQLLPDASLEEVTEQVGQWAAGRKDELETLRQNESYRRDFLMNFSHEIKTPIFTVQSYLHMLRDGLATDEALHEKFVSSSVRGIDRLAHLIKELDELIKLEQGEVQLQETEFDIVDLVRDVIEEFELLARQKDIKLSIKGDTSLRLTVRADKTKIRQALVNLVTNSIRYGNARGETTIATYVVDERNAYVEVTDNGIGIAEAHVPRVFERFYRTDDARGKHNTGTGLGLSIVKHIIEAHGHHVTCRSTLGVGSSFGFGISRA